MWSGVFFPWNGISLILVGVIVFLVSVILAPPIYSALPSFAKHGIDTITNIMSLTQNNSSSEQPLSEQPMDHMEYITSDKYLELATAPDYVFVKTDFFHVGPVMWRGTLHAPDIHDQIIISGQSDHPITPQIAAKYPNIRHWFAINNMSLDDRIVTLPLGLTNDTDESPLHRIYGNQEILRDVLRTVPKSSKRLVYLNFSATHPSREKVRTLFADKSFVTVAQSEPTMEGRKKYLMDLREHDFCLCPRGNGLDTHRLWESLYMGCIPIVEYDPAYRDFADLPILFVDDWAQVKEHMLHQTKSQFSKRVWNLDKLYMPYWRNRITKSPRLPIQQSYQSWVLIHIGPPIPAHAWDCIRQIRNVDPTSQIIFVSDQPSIDLEFVLHIPLDSIPMSSQRQKFTTQNQLSPGFWTWTCQRLFILHDLMEYAGLKNVIHIEYDNLVYFPIDWFCKRIPATSLWACPRLGPTRLIANVLYVRTPEPLCAWMQFVVSHTYENEMRYLHEFDSATIDRYKCFELPVSETHPNIAQFEGQIFDAAAIGQCIGGVDPKHTPGNTVGFVNEDSPWKDLVPSWIKTGKQKPMLKDKIPILNLHIHCKNLKQFM